MPTLSIDEFKLVNATCELRYKNAYLVYDRTGQVLQDLSRSFTDISISSSAPQQTAWVAQEGTFSLEIGTCRFTSARSNQSAETFAKQCGAYFDAVTKNLQINVFTRIGLRYIARKEYPSLDESKAALASMMLVNLKPTQRFKSSESPIEILFRWEDSQIGAFIRLRAETADIKLEVSPELQEHVPRIDKKIHGLTIDMDYYTVAPVEREQWNALEWLPQKLRIIKKEADGILQGGR